MMTTMSNAIRTSANIDTDIQEAIDDIIGEQEEIEFVFNTITMQFGPDTMLAAKIKLRGDMTINEAIASINLLERDLKKRVPNLKWIFIEPDVAD